jgi:peroxiredoxin
MQRRFGLPDRDHRPVALADFKGTPVLLVFLSGSGCAHCIEQLNSLAPLTKEFASAGISDRGRFWKRPMDCSRLLRKPADRTSFPFRIISDHRNSIPSRLPCLRRFRAWRCVAASTAKVFVRWQNISYQPFKELKWLVGEARRLLRVPGTPRTATAALQK